MSARTLLWICWVNILVCSVQSQNTILECPSFTDNATVTLALDVNNSTFSSCNIGPSTVTCSFTPRNGSPASVCSQSVKQCDPTPTSLGCWCTGATGTGYTYNLNFTARQNDHEGGNFSCSFDCTITSPSSSTPPPVSIASDCLNIAFAAPTTAPPNATSASPTTPPPGQEQDLLFLLFLLLLIPIAVVIIIVWYCFCHNAAKKAKGRELESLPQDQQTTNGSKPADGNGSVQRDNKVGTGHVATNGTS